MIDHTFIRAACAKLDPSDDTHWTSQGLPRMDVLANMGLTIERRELNEAMPGFCRAKLTEDRAAAATTGDAPEPPAEPEAEEPGAQPSFFLRAKERAARRAAALACLAKGGFSLKDLEPVRCRLEQRTTALNRQARRAIG